MLYELSAFSDGGDFFNLFRYITFRAGGAFITALFFGFVFGCPFFWNFRRSSMIRRPKTKPKNSAVMNA
ncbi:MAG: hypothetical protein AAFY66_11850, partial [Pseudomonadota bacterium]